ncbi:MAG: sigma 54-interacting transcriptional regulator [Nitrospinota bacterium]|nr:sigma 54-interacting transcriptional regulator [Nitrospinota bacterium]
MGELSFSSLNPIFFLQTIMSQAVRVAGLLNGGKEKNQGIIQIGLSAGGCFETAYRDEYCLTEPLTLEQYTDLIISLKNKIGGNFSIASSGPGFVRVTNTICPFGEAVKQASQLCGMTSSVFGGIAARNFGYAKVALNRCIGAGADGCDVCVYVDKKLGARAEGDVYNHDRGQMTSANGAVVPYPSLQEQISQFLCAPRPEKKDIRGRLSNIVAHSLSMREALRAVEIAAPTKASVLITGETGVGKELIARAVHTLSDREGKKFVAVNCGAVPENLIESSLFGHEKGAFTDAYEVHHGFFERAQGGTLFLDEIDSLPLYSQVRLLRVLQEEEFERVGGKQPIKTDVRIIAAGSERLTHLVEGGNFRRDLFYRLNVVSIHLQPLNKRPEDTLPLAERILEKLAAKYNAGHKFLAPEAAMAIHLHPWPGNVRELENVLERAYLFTSGREIFDLKIPDAFVNLANVAQLENVDLKEARKDAADKVEILILAEAMRRFKGNVKAVAKRMKLTPRAIHMKLKEHHIPSALYRTQPDEGTGA